MADRTRAVALLADVHGDLPALEAALADMAARGIGEVVVAGDHVGFGASPNVVVDRLAASGTTPRRGNHGAEYVAGHADSALRAPGGTPIRSVRRWRRISTASARPGSRS